MAYVEGLHPMLQALLATIFTWLVTALGAVPVFFAQGVSRKLLDLMLGFAIMMILDVALG